MKSNIRVYAEDHAPQILMIVGTLSMVGTTVLAVRATPKALCLIEDKKDELEAEKLTVAEYIKTTWRSYLPSVLTGVFGVTCLVGAMGVNAHRSTVLAAACTLSETAFRTYAEKTLEVVGEEKEKEIRQVIGQARIKETPPPTNGVYICGDGETLCYDGSSGRYFKSDMNTIKKAENTLNRRLMEEMSVNMNDYYYEIGLPTVTVGNVVGWNIDQGYLTLTIDSMLTDDGKPCIYVEPSLMPEHDFRESIR